MTKIKIILLSSVGLIGTAFAAMWVSFEGSTGALIEQFPDIDPTIVRKVHKEMWLESFKGTYNDIDDDADGSTGEYNRIFLEKVQKLTNSQ